MENLPNEILDRIIGYLDKKALLSVRLVNKTWQSLAEDYLRKEAHFSLEIDKDVSDLIKITSWRNENTIPPLFVRFTISKKLSKGILEELIREYGNAIQSLRFEGKVVNGRPPAIDHRRIFEFLMNTSNITEIYIMNHCNNVDMKRKYHKLYLPKLRILELGRLSTDFVQLILNSSPNIRQVKFGSNWKITEDNWRDHINIFQSIATRVIELKLEISIDFHSDQVNEQRLNEMARIPFKLTELILIVENDRYYPGDPKWSIEEFIHKHSTTLKLLHVSCNLRDVKYLWKLDLKNLDNLEELKLHCGIYYGGRRTMFQLNLGQVPAPMLKKVWIGDDTELNVESAPLLKHLCIEADNASEYLRRPLLLDDSVRLENLCLNFREYSTHTYTEAEADERVELLNNFLLSQAKNIKELEINARYTRGMNKLQLPRMENLQKLELKIADIKLKFNFPPSNFPHLKFLELDTPIFGNPSLNESVESVHTLILNPESLLDFKNTALHFPMLKKLHINKGTIRGILPFIFKNIRHLEELQIVYVGVTWEELTGNSEVVDFVGKTSTRNLNTPVPNLGDLIDLKRLIISTANTWMVEVKAIAYLISCGKLKNLRYFEVDAMEVSRGLRKRRKLDMDKLISVVKVFESNNTRINIPPFPCKKKM